MSVEVQAPIPPGPLENGVGAPHLTGASLPELLSPNRTPEPACSLASSCSASSSSSSSSSFSPATPTASEKSWTANGRASGMRRKKASRACGHCQKAHLTCDDGRPCLRCEKRGLGATCQDGVRKKAKYLRDYDDSLLVRRRVPAGTASGWTAGTSWKSADVGPNSENPWFSQSQPTWTAPGLLTSDPLIENSQTTISWGDDIFFGSTPTDSWSNCSSGIEGSLQEWLRGFEACGSLLKEPPAEPKNWEARLARELEIRKLARHINLEDEEMLRRSTDRSLQELERMITLSGTPTVVWTLFGDILKVGDEFCMLTEWSREELVGREISEIFEPQSLTEYLALIEKNAFEARKQQLLIKRCMIKKSSGSPFVTCSFCFTIRRDMFDFPLLVVGNFLPILIQQN